MNEKLMADFVSKFPAELQPSVLEIIKKENDRWERGDFTESERQTMAMAKRMGAAARDHVEKIVVDVLEGGSDADPAGK